MASDKKSLFVLGSKQTFTQFSSRRQGKSLLMALLIQDELLKGNKVFIRTSDGETAEVVDIVKSIFPL